MLQLNCYGTTYCIMTKTKLWLDFLDSAFQVAKAVRVVMWAGGHALLKEEEYQWSGTITLATVKLLSIITCV